MADLAPALNGVHIADGWKHEVLEDGRYGLFYPQDKMGFVTVDYKARVYRTGVVRHGPANCLASDYEGRGWRKRLERDAQSHLAWILAS